jgi:histidinol-phosphate/aromatic aminotransferase/cobyric acid decarboxylase-like protein
MLQVWRGPGRNQAIDVDIAADLPADALALLESPSDPLGALLSASDAVRLARACRLLVIDERLAEFSGVTLLPLAIEFDNIIVLRSFETWAAIGNPPCAWVAAPPRAAALVGFAGELVAPEAVAAAMATLENLASLDVMLRLLREERSRLYRFLRKLSFLEPIPSWGPFLAARVTLAPRQAVVSGLLARGIRVHVPSQPGLEQIIRIGIGSRTAMECLRQALLDLAPELVA